MNVKTSARYICLPAVAIGLLALLGQCQPVPRPFAPDHKGDFSAIQIGPRAGMIVSPITGAVGEAVGTKLAAAMARALRQREITASTNPGHRGSHRLQGVAALGPVGLLRLTWRLRTPADVETLTVIQDEVVAPAAGRSAARAGASPWPRLRLAPLTVCRAGAAVNWPGPCGRPWPGPACLCRRNLWTMA